MTRAMRNRCGMSRELLAQFIGVAPLTVGRWERAQTEPTAHQFALLKAMDAALCPQTCKQMRKILVGKGVVEAWRFVLTISRLRQIQKHMTAAARECFRESPETFVDGFDDWVDGYLESAIAALGDLR